MQQGLEHILINRGKLPTMTDQFSGLQEDEYHTHYMGAVPKTLCPDMVEIHKDSCQEANQDRQKTSCFNEIKATADQIHSSTLCLQQESSNHVNLTLHDALESHKQKMIQVKN